MKIFNNFNAQRILIILCTLTCAFSIKATTPEVSTMELMGRKFTAYKVAKKESLYAFARNNGLSYNSLLQWNQLTESEVPKDYILFLPQDSIASVNPTLHPQSHIKYSVKYGDTLYGIARKFNTTVEDIIVLNPQLRSSILTTDSEIQVHVNSAYENLVRKSEYVSGIISFKSYKVQKDESAEGIAATNGISVELLQQVNGLTEIKPKANITIPVIGQVEYEVWCPKEDVRENSSLGQQEIFDSIVNLTPSQSSTKVAIILSNPQSKKDVDFSRGFLTATKEFGPGLRQLDIKFINGTKPMTELLTDTSMVLADMVFTTYEGEVPAILASYCHAKGKSLINAFAVTDTLYRSNPAIVNLLSSPQEFNPQVSNYIIENFGNSYFVFIGDPLAAQDKIANHIMNTINTENFDVVTSLDQVIPHPSRPMVFYSLANNKKEIKENLEAINSWIETHPEVDVNTIGRPSWIIYADSYAEALRKAHGNIPTRFYFSQKEPASNQFLKKYFDFFNAEPVRSYPAYSVMGYDAAWNFLRPGADHQFLQMPFRLTRVPTGGEYNSSAFMLRYFPDMPLTKFDIIPYQTFTDE